MQDFLKSYGAEKTYRHRLLKLRWPTGFRYPRGGCIRNYTFRARNQYQCRMRKHQSALTIGTIFASFKLPLTARFLAIEFITHSRDGYSGFFLRRLLGISVDISFESFLSRIIRSFFRHIRIIPEEKLVKRVYQVIASIKKDFIVFWWRYKLEDIAAA